jgi:cyclic pyranopterin phosphate synthase
MSDLSHVDEEGKARMVDVSGKPVTARMARATGSIQMRRETLDAIRSNTVAKGDVLGVARVAGIMAAKRTSELVPLCHPIALSDVSVDFTLDDALPGIRVDATAKTAAQTGVEMEAIMAVSVSLITVYDMAKALDKSMVIGAISLTEKVGGKSGSWKRS